MAATDQQAAAPPPSVDRLLDELESARARTLELVAPLSDTELERLHSPLMSPLVWDLGHIAAYEDLWLVHRLAGEALLHPELADCYDAFETPRAARGDIELLGPDDARAYMHDVRRRAREAATRHGVGDGTLHEMVLRHEHQHNETMLQTLDLARLPGITPVRATPGAVNGGGIAAHTGLETVDVPAGAFELGARVGRFSYDNERPRHRTDVRGFGIGRTPVTNGTWLTFAEGGGYERREWWSDEGWAWKEEYDIGRPGGWAVGLPESHRPPDPSAGHGEPMRLGGQPVYEWRCGSWEPLHPNSPVLHVSWFEADAFARAHGVRLPTEVEWEKATTWDPGTGDTRDWPWGDGDPTPDRANLFESAVGATSPAGAYPAGAAASGALGLIGDVWEWTSSVLRPYPGFRAHPYREYSEVFFTGGYRVLRGGSWATSTRVATPTFRNWDHPQRRQIFSGLRIARDA